VFFVGLQQTLTGLLASATVYLSTCYILNKADENVKYVCCSG